MAIENGTITKEFLHGFLQNPNQPFDSETVFEAALSLGIKPSVRQLDDIAKRGDPADIFALEWWYKRGGVHPTEKSYCWLIENTLDSMAIDWFHDTFPGLAALSRGE